MKSVQIPLLPTKFLLSPFNAGFQKNIFCFFERKRIQIPDIFVLVDHFISDNLISPEKVNFSFFLRWFSTQGRLPRETYVQSTHTQTSCGQTGLVGTQDNQWEHWTNPHSRRPHCFGTLVWGTQDMSVRLTHHTITYLSQGTPNQTKGHKNPPTPRDSFSVAMILAPHPLASFHLC